MVLEETNSYLSEKAQTSAQAEGSRVTAVPADLTSCLASGVGWLSQK